MSDDDLEILRPVLARFAAGWGASVDCEEGWWPIIAELDRQIAVIAPGYEVHQIKEKFGTLRYYCAPTGDEPSPAVCDAFRAIIGEAERASAVSCERCGEPGVLHETRYLVKTLCASCAGSRGYTPAQHDTT